MERSHHSATVGWTALACASLSLSSRLAWASPLGPAGSVAGSVASAGTGAPPRKGVAVLRYERRESAPLCPDEPAFEQLVIAQLGYDPFQPGVAETIAIKLGAAAEGPGLAAELTVWRDDSDLLAQRQVHADTADCRDLVATLALMVELMLAPPDSTPRPREPTAVAEPALEIPPLAEPPRGNNPVTKRAEPVSTLAQAPVSPSFRLPAPALRFHVSGHGVIGTDGPDLSPSVGVSAGVGATWSHASLTLEGRFDFPSSADLAGGGQSRTSLLTASLVPCGLATVPPLTLGACGVIALGSQHAQGVGLPVVESLDTPYAAAGGRLSVSLPLAQHFGLELDVDVLVPFVTTTLQIEQLPVWTTPPVSALLGLALTYAL